MGQQFINTGITPNDGLADSLLTGALKINQNFNEVYITKNNYDNINPVWLHASFNGAPETLYIQASYDLQIWYVLSSYTAPVRSIRDPKLLYHRSIWYCAYTESENANGIGKSFGLAQSRDLINWTSIEIDLSSQLATSGRVWQPLLIEDISGNACCTVQAVDAGRIFYLEPTDQNDLKTLKYVQDVVTPWTGDCNSVVLVSGLYYLDANNGNSTHYLFTGVSMRGPFGFTANLTANGVIQNDAIAVMHDNPTNLWYAFGNGPTANSSVAGVVPYQISSGGFNSFGSVNFGMVLTQQGCPLPSTVNPDPHHCYGAEAESVRNAIDQILNRDRLIGAVAQPLPRGVAFTTSGGGNAFLDTAGLSSAGWAPLVVNNATSGARATACICPSIDLYGSPLGNKGKEWEFHANVEIDPSPTSPVRFLFGVPYNKLGTLNHAGWGLEFFYTHLNFLSHDGATLTATNIFTGSTYTGRMDIRIRVRYSFITIWINSVLVYKTYTYPNSIAGLDNTYQSIVMQADGLDNTQAVGWFLGGYIKVEQ